MQQNHEENFEKKGCVSERLRFDSGTPKIPKYAKMLWSAQIFRFLKILEFGKKKNCINVKIKKSTPSARASGTPFAPKRSGGYNY